MQLEHLPLLHHHREIYSLPRGRERFRRYLATLTGGGNDLVLPLGAMNPMGKEHMLRAVDAWLSAGAEEEAAAGLHGTRRHASTESIDRSFPGQPPCPPPVASSLVPALARRVNSSRSRRVSQ
jgi:hypothetical protein